jgi:hypothetical protein
MVFAGFQLCAIDSAKPLEKGEWEIGIIKPIRFGLGNGREIFTYKLLTLKMPNVSYKKLRWRKSDWDISTRHSLYYPTPFLKWLQSPLGMELGGPNMFALISPEFDIPHMVSIWNSVIATREIIENVHFTGIAEFGIAFGANELAKESTVDLPFIFTRLAVYYNGAVVKMGSSIHSKINKHWGYVVSGEAFLMPGAPGEFAFENTSQIEWERHSGFRVLFGYKLIYGEYPFGGQAHIFPAFDFIWRRG